VSGFAVVEDDLSADGFHDVVAFVAVLSVYFFCDDVSSSAEFTEDLHHVAVTSSVVCMTRDGGVTRMVLEWM